MRYRVIAIFVAAFLTTSCGTTKISSDDMSEVKSGKKAIVQTYNQPLLGGLVFGDQPVVKVIAVDGKKIDSAIFKLDEQLALEVGSHEIEFNCANRAGVDERDFSETMTLELKPHTRYLVRCSFDSSFGPNGTYTGSFSVKEKPIK